MRKVLAALASVICMVPLLAWSQDSRVMSVPDGDWTRYTPKVINPSREPIREWAPKSKPQPFEPTRAAKQPEDDFSGWRRNNPEPLPVMLEAARDGELPTYLPEPQPAEAVSDDLRLE